MLARVAQRTSAASKQVEKILSEERDPKRTLVGAQRCRTLVSSTRVLSSSSEESYTAKQAKTGRPLSPHVTIYDFPPAAITSIANRVTGVALVAGLYGVGAASLVGCDAPLLMSTLGGSAAGPAVKLAVSFPLVYHYLGAVRHTVWDFMPETLQIAGVQKASYALMGASGAISLGLAVV